ncbi:hypothetical protein PPACK8108_LOCUS7316 [Phakopsora pachyrhizi]|uniref:Uncharacterized protein n=1 Tax=Phakopsora pachyrhizi TaxID=170000 RepID=A0AAV0ASK5_PHAPC|nr:hypothetical protein PPACK8108_LOCUS7316 [Phakopsora pachyrhizi]
MYSEHRNIASQTMILDDEKEIDADNDLCNFTYNKVAEATMGFNIFDSRNFINQMLTNHDMKDDSLILEEPTRCSTNRIDIMTENAGIAEDSALVSINEKIKNWFEDLDREIERLKTYIILPDLYQTTIVRLETCEADLDEAKILLYLFQDKFGNMNKL